MRVTKFISRHGQRFISSLCYSFFLAKFFVIVGAPTLILTSFSYSSKDISILFKKITFLLRFKTRFSQNRRAYLLVWLLAVLLLLPFLFSLVPSHSTFGNVIKICKKKKKKKKKKFFHPFFFF